MLEVADAVADDQVSAPPHATSARLIAVRIAKPEDFHIIRPLVEEYHEESRYRGIRFSERKLQRLVARTASNPDNIFAAYVRYKDRAVGIVHANAGDYYLGEGARMVTVQGIFVTKTLRPGALGGRVMLKLMRLLGDWASATNASELHIYSTSGISPRRTDRTLHRLGFETYGGCYVREVGKT